MPGDLRWSWCNNNRNKVHNKCNVFESSWNSYPPLAPGKLSSMKLVPGAKKIGDPAVLREQTKQWRTSLVVQWLILCVSTAGGLGLIPSWRSSACLAVWPKRGGETMETSCPKELWIPKDQVELSKICLITVWINRKTISNRTLNHFLSLVEVICNMVTHLHFGVFNDILLKALNLRR